MSPWTSDQQKILEEWSCHFSLVWQVQMFIHGCCDLSAIWPLWIEASSGMMHTGFVCQGYPTKPFWVQKVCVFTARLQWVSEAKLAGASWGGKVLPVYTYPQAYSQPYIQAYPQAYPQAILTNILTNIHTSIHINQSRRPSPNSTPKNRTVKIYYLI